MYIYTIHILTHDLTNHHLRLITCDPCMYIHTYIYIYTALCVCTYIQYIY